MKKLTALDVKKCLLDRHPSNEWVWAEEFNLTPGYSRPAQGGGRIDGFAFNCWPSHGHLMVGYEVKVSRSDFLHELKKPEKRKVAVDFCDQFYFAVPLGLVHPSEVPPDCGLVECWFEGKEPKSRLRLNRWKRNDWSTADELVNRQHPRWLIAAIIRQFDPRRINGENAGKVFTLQQQMNDLRFDLKMGRAKAFEQFEKHLRKHGVWGWSAQSILAESFCV